MIHNDWQSSLPVRLQTILFINQNNDMHTYEKLLLENKAWAKDKTLHDPEFFPRLSHLQTPEFLWIGCSDSRARPMRSRAHNPGRSSYTGISPYMVVHTDVNLLSVLEYAVTQLKVKHIIVCGHYGYGGVKAAMENTHWAS